MTMSKPNRPTSKTRNRPAWSRAHRETADFMKRLVLQVDLDRAELWPSALPPENPTVNILLRSPPGPLHLLIGSTDIKLDGGGEWNAGKHCDTQRRV